MAVVINDMEVTPQSAGQAGSQLPSSDAGLKDKIKQMETNMHKEQQRKHRLEAY